MAHQATLLSIHNGRHDGEIREYFFAIDVETGKILANDWESFHQAERTAYRAKYGKFHPRLYDHLQTISDDIRITVSTWISGTKTDLQIYQELGPHFLEMAQAIAQGENPRDLTNIVLALGKDPNNRTDLENPAVTDLQERIKDKYRRQVS